jgi:molecular chaperone IbpA
MRRFDFAPLTRATVGFDQIAELIDSLVTADSTTPNYPPYNIEKTAEDAWRITVAVAGFADADLGVEQRENALIVTARKTPDDAPRTYLHRGIANRAFERRFQLGAHVRVTGAAHEDGLLHIDLAREVPEALRPRRVEIASKAGTTLLVEAQTVN